MAAQASKPYWVYTAIRNSDVVRVTARNKREAKVKALPKLRNMGWVKDHNGSNPFKGLKAERVWIKGVQTYVEVESSRSIRLRNDHSSSS